MARVVALLLGLAGGLLALLDMMLLSAQVIPLSSLAVQPPGPGPFPWLGVTGLLGIAAGLTGAVLVFWRPALSASLTFVAAAIVVAVGAANVLSPALHGLTIAGDTITLLPGAFLLASGGVALGARRNSGSRRRPSGVQTGGTSA